MRKLIFCVLLLPSVSFAYPSDPATIIDDAMVYQYPDVEWIDDSGSLQDPEAYELDYVEKCGALIPDTDAIEAACEYVGAL